MTLVWGREYTRVIGTNEERSTDEERPSIRRRAPTRRCVVLAVVALALVAASCGSSNNNSSSSSATGPDINAQGEGKLNIVDWEGYTDPSFVKGFEKQTGCKVNDVFAGTSDEMFTKFRSGGGGQYDLASFSGDASLRAIKSGAVAPLDTSKLTNFKDLAPQLQSPTSTPQDGKHYGLSFMWGANVLIYNADKIKHEPRLLERALRPQVQGQDHGPGQPDPDRGPGAPVLRREEPVLDRPGDARQGQGQAQAAAPARAQVLGARDRLRRSLFKSGDATIGAGWPLMTNDLRKAGMNVKEVIPKEGVTGWSDSWMLSKKAKHPICAYKYMNYVTQPDMQVKVVDVTGYSPANLKTCELARRAAVQGPARPRHEVLRLDQVLGDADRARPTTGSGRTPGRRSAAEETLALAGAVRASKQDLFLGQAVT